MPLVSEVLPVAAPPSGPTGLPSSGDGGYTTAEFIFLAGLLGFGIGLVSFALLHQKAFAPALAFAPAMRRSHGAAAESTARRLNTGPFSSSSLPPDIEPPRFRPRR